MALVSGSIKRSQNVITAASYEVEEPAAAGAGHGARDIVEAGCRNIEQSVALENAISASRGGRICPCIEMSMSKWGNWLYNIKLMWLIMARVSMAASSFA